jgi:outer membrane protein assembly factor BamB
MARRFADRPAALAPWWALLVSLGCQGPPAAAPDGAAPDRPLSACPAPPPAPDGGLGGAPDPSARGQLVWQFRDPVLSFPAAEPALGEDGTVYAAQSLRLFALSPQDGTLRWSTASTEAEAFVPAPLVDEAGRVAITSAEVALYVFAADGRPAFRTQLEGPPQNGGPVTAPVRLPSGFAFGAGARLFLLDDCGQPIAIYDHDRLLAGPLCAGPDGFLFAAEPAAGAVIAVAPDGSRSWRTVLGADQVPGGLALDGGAVVVTTGSGGRVYWLDASSGQLRAQAEPGGRVGAPVALADGGWVVAGTPADAPSTGRLYAFGADGSARWQLDLPGRVTLLPALTTAGIVVGTENAQGTELVLVSTDGALVFASDCADCTFVSTSPAVGPDGTLYTSALSRLVALRAPGALDPRSPWPRARGADERNSGRPRHGR